MSKTLFSINYEINPSKRNEYLGIIRELKLIVKSEGLESYNVYEVKGKTNHFMEVFTFTSYEAFEAFDDNQDERINLLIDKIADISINNSSKYSTYSEVSE